MALSVIIVLYISIGVMSAAGSVAISKSCSLQRQSRSYSVCPRFNRRLIFGVHGPFRQ